MSLNDLANISQIIAAFGVVISLIYLAAQIRGNTKVVSAPLLLAECISEMAPGKTRAALMARLVAGDHESGLRAGRQDVLESVAGENGASRKMATKP
jgi:hypothetical protein